MNKSPSSSIPASSPPNARLLTAPALAPASALAPVPSRPAAGTVAAAPTTPQDSLVYAVRHYVHFDNLAETLNKQVSNVRNLRAKFENEILTTLEAQGIKNAVLQISGATLQRQTRYQSTNLSWSFLEEQLNEYYKSKGKPNETAGILEFIQSHRGGKAVDYLKKTGTTTGAPGSK